MARIRYVKPDYFMDEDLASLDFVYRYGYAGLWIHADREGRLEDRPKKLKSQIYPYDNVDMEDVLKTLAEYKKQSGDPFILRYRAAGRRFIQILKFNEHQKPHKQEPPSKIPPPTLPNPFRTASEQDPKEPRSASEPVRKGTGTGTGTGTGIGTGTGTGMGTGTGTGGGSTPAVHNPVQRKDLSLELTEILKPI